VQKEKESKNPAKMKVEMAITRQLNLVSLKMENIIEKGGEILSILSSLKQHEQVCLLYLSWGVYHIFIIVVVITIITVSSPSSPCHHHHHRVITIITVSSPSSPWPFIIIF